MRSVKFDIPVIGVGNLTAGGTGKTPHIEYLVHQLQYVYQTATLSRGYGRKTHGFLVANIDSTAKEIGDEPRQFKRKFPQAIVSVGEDRVLAVPQIITAFPNVDVILLDDAYQHRAIRPGLSVLLTEYSNLFTRDDMMPIGWLREPKTSYHRADLIIVTKCPDNISETERKAIIQEINPFRYQRIYFSALRYFPLYSLLRPQLGIELDDTVNVLLLCGIANFEPLKTYLQKKAGQVFVRDFKDHHTFDEFDLDSVRETYKNMGEVKKIIVTTEKDAARLEPFTNWFYENKIEIFVQPVSVSFLFDDKTKFDRDIQQYIEVTRHKIHNTDNQ